MQLVKVTTSGGANDEFRAALLLFKTRAMAAAAAVADVAGHGATASAVLADANTDIAEDTELGGAESEATEKGWF